MLALLLTAVVAVEPGLQRALERQLQLPGARVQVVAWTPPRCQGELQVPAVEASGRVPVHVRGPRCDEWGWATVRVTVEAPVVTRTLRSGEALQGAWAYRWAEVSRGRPLLATVPEDATAARALRGGDALGAEAVRSGPQPGTSVTVRVALGGIIVEQPGRVVGCPGPNVCAVLPSGRRVTGHLEGEALSVGASGGRP